MVDPRISVDAVAIRLGVVGDAAPLGALARRVFIDTFSNDPDHKPHDMAMHLATVLSDERFAQELADTQTPYFIAQADAQMIGYLKLCTDHAPDCVRGERPLEIARLYVDFAWHRSGIAHTLMQRSVEFAERGGHDCLWLGVWHRNERAQRFYRKWGFAQVGEHPYQFGTDRQVDLVFSRPLRLASS